MQTDTTLIAFFVYNWNSWNSLLLY